MSGYNYPGGNTIVLGENCPRELPRGAIVLGGNCLGAIFQGAAVLLNVRKISVSFCSYIKTTVIIKFQKMWDIPLIHRFFHNIWK